MGAGKERVREGCKWVQARAQVERGSRAARERWSRDAGVSAGKKELTRGPGCQRDNG